MKKNLIYFFDQLNSKYMNNSIPKNYTTQLAYTKIPTPTYIKNQTYDIDPEKYKDIINAHKNEEIENCINNITINIT